MGRSGRANKQTSRGEGWYSSCASIPEDEVFNTMVHGFVFQCPSARKLGKGSEVTYVSVSNRDRCTFRSRNITGGLLTTLGARIKRLANEGCYQVVGAKSSAFTSVDEATRRLAQSPNRSDELCNLIVFRRRSEMSDAEAVFYAVRNAFAHGSFEVVSPAGGERVYLLEAARGEVVQARIRLKESQVRELLRLGGLNKGGVRRMRRRRSKR